jgi:hypothetical protein
MDPYIMCRLSWNKDNKAGEQNNKSRDTMDLSYFIVFKYDMI